MRQLNVIFLVTCLTILTISGETSTSSTIDYDQEWVAYKLKYSKSYSNVDEDEARKRLWRNNLDKVNYHNDKADRGLRSYRLTVNQFTDLVQGAEEIPNSDYHQSTGTDQFSRSRLGLSRFESYVNSTVIVENDDDLPEAVDWRNHGWVSPVRHRRGCWQSGWAFAIIDAIEGQVFNATKRLTPLSVAALIDCSFGSNQLLGCLNGTIKDGYEYLMDNNPGLPIEKDYPYSGYRRRCHHYPLAMVNVTIKGYRQVEPTEQALKRAVATIGPISAMMDAGGEFRTYSSGVYNDNECGTRELNHGITIVGYGREKAKDYWIVRNNNGNIWGERGYVRIQRNLNNLCGLASQAYYPIL